MTTALNREEITARYLAACRAELQALKPGNVHRHSAGHGMSVETFERAAAASAPAIADPALKVGERILAATEASFAATSLNTNLGIVLLCAPLAKAAAECEFGVGLRRRLDAILARLDEDDADKAFAAIRLANPAGLGKVDEGDVSVSGPKMTLIAAMRLAADRDRIANSYITAFSDIFDFALPFYGEALRLALGGPIAVGEKVTLISQEDCGPSDAGQLLVAEKSAVAETLLTIIGIWRSLLVSVTVCGALVVPTVTSPKLT